MTVDQESYSLHSGVIYRYSVFPKTAPNDSLWEDYTNSALFMSNLMVSCKSYKHTKSNEIMFRHFGDIMMPLPRIGNRCKFKRSYFALNHSYVAQNL